ncbi:uncharacterized protein LOC119441850 [Dermacentor silvarum]|uniref:uncharacterized protein LOC119441850 n=1 Tax=Dermacentor silvarum TaxID=543639 RepID=UPI0021019312|nr:uncharacterized protein LOC119441850 [Dermacentor silvarum]
MVLDTRRRRSAPGADGLTFQTLRNIDAAQLPSLLQEFNHVWRTGCVPATWREAVVVPLLKSGKPAGCIGSYRPVSLTSVAADSLSEVVATLEESLSRHEAGCYLILLDVQSAFDGLPHATIIGCLHELGVTGRLLQYIRAFLTDRTLRVRVGGALSDPRGVFSGVPQGSVLSPFLFNLALSRLPDFIPRTTSHEVRSAIYADDIAIFACGPTEVGYLVRASIQTAVDAVDEYFASIGLQLSTAKTEALMVHPRAARARFEVPPLTLRGRPLPWRKSVRYLGLQIDCRLNFNAAVSHLCRESRKVVGGTLAEAGNWPPSLRAKKQALHHIERLQRSLPGQRLVCRLHSLHNSGMGRRASEYTLLIDSYTQLVALPQLPHASSLLKVNIKVPGVSSKRQTAVCAMRQETAALMHEQLGGRLLVFTDGSVARNGPGAAACTAPDIGETRQCRLRFAVSSTVAELAAIDLAADLLLQQPDVVAAAILSDSRAALSLLARDFVGGPLVQRWVPAHIGLEGNEHADALAKEAHAERFPLSPLVTSFDSARTTILRSLSAQHPDARVASAAARTHRLRGIGSGVCANCADMETLEHLLLHCPAFGVERAVLTDSYHRYGLPANSLKDLLFPDAHSSLVKRVLSALLDFCSATNLRARL